MPPIHNRLIQNPIRRKLRRSMTEPEIMLWSRLKKRAVSGYKFRRQHGVGPFVLDFYCPELLLGIEVDGIQHQEAAAIKYDQARTEYLRHLNIKIIRISNGEVRSDLSGVMEGVEDEVRRRAVFLDHLPGR